MPDAMRDEEFFEDLAAGPELAGRRAPSRVKSKIYSALVMRQAETGALLPLGRVKEGGRRLCVFEELVQIAPVGEKMESWNYCRVCHARVLGERVEKAPIYWWGCPYVTFQK